MNSWFNDVQWDYKGLAPSITQDVSSGEILMMAWMNVEALTLTQKHQRAVYWSRSRNQLWFKGEESGYFQTLKEIRLDCDSDVILIKVEQIGGIACHTGHRCCFFRVLYNGKWHVDEQIVKSPEEIYK